MAGGEGYFAEADPEWAVSQLRSHLSATGTQPPPRRLPWLVAAGVLLTTALVAGGFLLGLTRHSGSTDLTPSAPPITRGEPSGAPVKPPASPRSVAPQVTLAAVPRARHTAPPRKSEPPVVVVTVYSTPPAPAPTAQSHKPSNQVGPNRPIKTPIDPDD